MQGSPFPKIILVLVLVVGAFVGLFFLRTAKRVPPTAPAPVAAAAPTTPVHPDFPTAPPRPDVLASTNGETDIPNCPLTRAQIEAWLAKHHRDARSLLAAFRTSHDTNYLNEAATNFPGDAGVQISVLAHDEFPADRRKWLDALKTSSPSNSFANYLSAQDYFKNGQTDLAVQELLAASAKPEFDSHDVANILDAQEMYQESGLPETQIAGSAMGDMAEDNMPELSTLKQLDSAMADLMKQKNADGDNESALNVATMGMQLAHDIDSGDSGKFSINNLVARAIEGKFVSQLDPNTTYDFLDNQTPAQVQQQLAVDKADFKQTLGQFQTVQFGLYQDPAAMNAYMQRMLIYGEPAAMKWAVQQYPPPAPPASGQ